MKNNYKLGLATITASLALVGCGGGSSSGVPEVSGNLFNTYVEGATYVCSSGKTGTTDKMGTYTCNVGDTVEFFLGKFSIGSADAAEGILDTDTLSADDTADTDLLQLLQGIDDESDGVITIPENFSALDALVDLNISLGDGAFETIIAQETDIQLVSESVAVNNHAENLLQAYLGGKTLYLASQDMYVDKWVFDENLTKVNATYTAGAETGSSTIINLALANGALTIENGDPLEFVEKTADYILFNQTANTVTTPLKLYFDEVYAKAVFEGYIVITEEKLSGKTFYSYEEDTDYNGVVLEEIYAKMTFSNGTVTRTEFVNVIKNYEVVESFQDTFTVSYTIIDGKIKADIPAFDGDPAEYGWITLLSENTDSWDIKDEGDNYQDGTIDWSENTTWYLSKPANYPTAL